MYDEHDLWPKSVFPVFDDRAGAFLRWRISRPRLGVLDVDGWGKRVKCEEQHTHTLVPSAIRPGCAATLLQAIVAPLSVSSFRNDIARTGPAAAAAAAANDAQLRVNAACLAVANAALSLALANVAWLLLLLLMRLLLFPVSSVLSLLSSC